MKALEGKQLKFCSKFSAWGPDMTPREGCQVQRGVTSSVARVFPALARSILIVKPVGLAGNKSPVVGGERTDVVPGKAARALLLAGCEQASPGPAGVHSSKMNFPKPTYKMTRRINCSH